MFFQGLSHIESSADGIISVAKPSTLKSMQATIDGPLISQARLKARATQAQIYAYTNADALASTSNVAAG